MKIHVGLNSKDISNAIRQIEQFKNDLLSKMELFCNELAEVGIEVAKQNIIVEEDGVPVDRSNLVTFSKELSPSVDGATCIVIPSVTPYVTKWKRSKNGKKVLTAEVNPLLMAEFGSGAKAIDGHRGTFPSETAKKNAAHGSWAWYDTKDIKHVTVGNAPSRPIYKAKLEMEQQIAEVAERVFNT